MAPKAVTNPDEGPQAKVGEDLLFIALPMITYREISDAAAKRGLTFSQAMQQALNNWMEAEPKQPKLLVEAGSKENGK